LSTIIQSNIYKIEDYILGGSVIRERSFDGKISKSLQNSEKEKYVSCPSAKYYHFRCE
jgi:hypothetical protein